MHISVSKPIRVIQVILAKKICIKSKNTQDIELNQLNIKQTFSNRHSITIIRSPLIAVYSVTMVHVVLVSGEWCKRSSPDVISCDECVVNILQVNMFDMLAVAVQNCHMIKPFLSDS
jgi:hypothetical protein